MKFLVAICFVYCVMSQSFGLQPLEEINNALEEILANFSSLQQGRSGSLDCYNIYLPEIKYLAEESKREIEVCSASANLTKRMVKEKFSDEQTRIDSDANKLLDALDSCSTPENTMAYLTCINNYSGQYMYYVDSITTESSKLLYRIKTKFDTINQQEADCIESAMNNMKTRTNETLTNLQNCLNIVSGNF